MTPGGDGQHAPLVDAGAYALGALEPDEELRLQRHLRGCAERREEVAAMRQVVGTLALSAPQYAAPAALRKRVLASVGSGRSGVVATRRPLIVAPVSRRAD